MRYQLDFSRRDDVDIIVDMQIDVLYWPSTRLSSYTKRYSLLSTLLHVKCTLSFAVESEIQSTSKCISKTHIGQEGKRFNV